MERLYLGVYIKCDKVEAALHRAKIKGLLRGVDDRSLRSFLEGFEKVIEARRGKFKDKIDYGEVEEIIRVMGKNRSDYVDNQELETISSVILDKDFIF